MKDLTMRVLIAVDDSACSQDALDSVSIRLWKEGTKFLIVHVLEPVSPEYAAMFITYTTAYGQVVAERLNEAQTLIDEKVDFLKRSLASQIKNENDITGLVLEGPVTECIVEHAKEWKADFIILGSHGRSGINKLILGSVAESVLTTSPCSVEVIKESANRKEGQFEKNSAKKKDKMMI